MSFNSISLLKTIAYVLLFSAVSAAPGDAGRKKKPVMQPNKITDYFPRAPQEATPSKLIATNIATPLPAHNHSIKAVPLVALQAQTKVGTPSVVLNQPKVVATTTTPVKVAPSSIELAKPKLVVVSTLEKKAPQLSTPLAQSISLSVQSQKTVASPIQGLQKTPVSSYVKNLAPTLSKPFLSPTLRQQRKVETGAQIEQIVGRDEHFNEFNELIKSARKKIEIFSWTLDFLPKEAFLALKKATEEGVELILTVNEVKNETTRETLEDLGIQINEGRITHTKLMHVDDRVAVVGSYNFLSASGNEEDREEFTESSFKISGDSALVKKIRGRIYRDMICHEKGEKPLLNHLNHDLSSGSKLHLLTNLGHHQEFFASIVAHATQKVVMYSPFVFGSTAKERLGEMAKTLKNNVLVTLYALEDQIPSLRWALNQHPSLKNRVTLKTTEAHRKSLLVDPDSSDDCYLCEGSFNWLSAANSLESDAAKQETSIVVSGPRAKRLLENYDLEY